MTFILWIATAMSLALSFPVSLRCINEGVLRVRDGVLALDLSIPVQSTIAAIFSGAAFWYGIVHAPHPVPDSIAFPLALIGASGCMSFAILGGFAMSSADPRIRT